MSKKVLVIGGTSGLGRRISELYAATGHTVGVIGRRETLLDSLKKDYPQNITIKKGDIAQEDIQEVINTLIKEMNGVDIIILSASVIYFNPPLNIETENKTISIDVCGYTNILLIAWHYFKQKGKGHIVGITSIAKSRGNKNAPAYHAAKAFQSTYLESLRVKAKSERNNIRITELIPGYMNTDMGKGDRLFWVVPLNKAAHQSIKAIEKGKNRSFISKRWRLIYFIQRLLPDSLYDWLINGSWKLKQKK